MECKSLLRVRFCVPSVLERLGEKCFSDSGLCEIHLPESLKYVGGGAFSRCTLTNDDICAATSNFCVCDCLLIDKSTWQVCSLISSVSDICIPDFVHELCDRCFKDCSHLCRVTFSTPSLVERIGVESFFGTSVEDISVPDSVRLLSERCFYRCDSLSRVIFGGSSSIETIGAECFSMTSIRYLFIPDCVRDLCDRCFYECKSLSRVRFGKYSSLERVGVEAFSGVYDGCPIKKIYIPDGVKELCSRCFASCRYLSCIRFGACTSLESIGADSFSGTPVGDMSVRENPRELSHRGFCGACPVSWAGYGVPSCDEPIS